MRWWPILSCFFFFACGSEPDGSPVSARDSIASAPESVAVETKVSTAQDTASHASFTPPPVKRPSGIYQLLLPYQEDKILHTIAFYPSGFRLQEEYLNKPDSVVVTEGTWTPSQGFIWLYKEQLVRGRYVWKGDSLQYYSPRLQQKFSLTKLTPASQNKAWQERKREGAFFYGIGTEPFWSVELNRNDSVVLSMPDWSQPLRAKLTGTTGENKNTIYTAATDSLQVAVYPYFCSDGMSDFTYTNKVVVRYKGQVYKGCGMRL